jgi:hypothetical protein
MNLNDNLMNSNGILTINHGHIFKLRNTCNYKFMVLVLIYFTLYTFSIHAPYTTQNFLITTYLQYIKNIVILFVMQNKIFKILKYRYSKINVIENCVPYLNVQLMPRTFGK